jgi:hypothetical protein
MMNEGAYAFEVREELKKLPAEILDVPAWKRFDTGGRLFWNRNTRAGYAEARKIIEARKS